MARGEVERTVRASVLDRLADDRPGTSSDPPLTWNESVERYKAAVLRDLEWLLNTRRTPEDVPDACDEVKSSVHYYGLPDITSLSSDSPTDRQWLARRVREAIDLFEPRLSDLRVNVPEEQERERRLVRFVIEGRLEMEPNPEQVVFDTVLEVASGRFRVGGDDE